MTYTIDLTHIISRPRFWHAVRHAIPLPDYFGNNLDALYDVLSEPGHEGTYLFQHCADFHWKQEVYYHQLVQLFADLHEENPAILYRFDE